MEQNRVCVAVVATVSMELDRINVRRIHGGSEAHALHVNHDWFLSGDF